MKIKPDLRFTADEVKALARMARDADVTVNTVIEGIVRFHLLTRVVQEPRGFAHGRLVRDEASGRTFPSASAAARAYNLHPRLVSEVLAGRRKTTGGRAFTYV